MVYPLILISAYGWDYTAYILPIIILLIGVMGILAKSPIVELLAGIFVIVLAALIAANPVIVTDTAYLPNGSALITLSTYTFHPYTEIAYIVFGVLMMISGAHDYGDDI